MKKRHQEEIAMPRKRSAVLKSLLLGLLAAVLFSLAAMLALAAVLVYFHPGDQLVTALNQVIKVIAIVLGACAAVSRGSERGFATGLTLALVYMVLGYALYIVLGGAQFSFSAFLGELLLGSAVGAVTGAVRANMLPRRRHIRANI